MNTPTGKIGEAKVVSLLTALFVFLLILDPGNVILGLKIPAFALLVIACALTFRSIWRYALPICLTVYLILGLTTALNLIFNDYPMDRGMAIYIYQTFLMMFLLLWINRLRFIERLHYPGLVVSGIVLTLWVIMAAFPEIEPVVYAFQEERFPGTLMMSRRTFLGIEMIGVYYNSTATLLLPMSIFLHKLLYNPGHKIRYLIWTMILIAPLLLGGTRAGMLAGMGCVVVLVLIKLWEKRSGKIIALIGAVAGIFIGAALVLMLLGETTETSNEAKSGLLDSFTTLVNEHPQVLLFGQGAGATFETEAHGSQTAIMEWSYLELIRWFGIPFMLVIVAIYVLPLFSIYKNRRELPWAVPIMTAYLFYLMVAGTNPLLLGSNGILVMLTVYSYAFNHAYRQPPGTKYPAGHRAVQGAIAGQ